MSLPEYILTAAVQQPLGGISIVAGAGCSFEEPTNIPLSKQCSEQAFQQLIPDGQLAEADCANPADLSALADVVYAKFHSQRKLVERLPQGCSAMRVRMTDMEREYSALKQDLKGRRETWQNGYQGPGGAPVR